MWKKTVIKINLFINCAINIDFKVIITRILQTILVSLIIFRIFGRFHTKETWFRGHILSIDPITLDPKELPRCLTLTRTHSNEYCWFENQITEWLFISNKWLNSFDFNGICSQALSSFQADLISLICWWVLHSSNDLCFKYTTFMFLN